MANDQHGEQPEPISEQEISKFMGRLWRSVEIARQHANKHDADLKSAQRTLRETERAERLSAWIYNILHPRDEPVEFDFQADATPQRSPVMAPLPQDDEKGPLLITPVSVVKLEPETDGPDTDQQSSTLLGGARGRESVSKSIAAKAKNTSAKNATTEPNARNKAQQHAHAGFGSQGKSATTATATNNAKTAATSSSTNAKTATTGSSSKSTNLSKSSAATNQDERGAKSSSSAVVEDDLELEEIPHPQHHFALSSDEESHHFDHIDTPSKAATSHEESQPSKRVRLSPQVHAEVAPIIEKQDLGELVKTEARYHKEPGTGMNLARDRAGTPQNQHQKQQQKSTPPSQGPSTPQLHGRTTSHRGARSANTTPENQHTGEAHPDTTPVLTAIVNDRSIPITPMNVTYAEPNDESESSWTLVGSHGLTESLEEGTSHERVPEERESETDQRAEVHDESKRNRSGSTSVLQQTSSAGKPDNSTLHDIKPQAYHEEDERKEKKRKKKRKQNKEQMTPEYEDWIRLNDDYAQHPDYYHDYRQGYHPHYQDYGRYGHYGGYHSRF